MSLESWGKYVTIDSQIDSDYIDSDYIYLCLDALRNGNQGRIWIDLAHINPMHKESIIDDFRREFPHYDFQKDNTHILVKIN